MNFQDYIKTKGWVPSRNNDNFFSSAAPNSVDVAYRKDGKEIVWGLDEAGYPPSLIYPRIDRATISETTNADLLEICLKLLS